MDAVRAKADMKTVAAALMEDDGKILVVRRAPGERLAGLWEFPGEKLEDGETLETCLARELCEELGTTCEIGGVFAETDYHHAHGAIRLVALEAKILEGSVGVTAHDRVAWLPPTDLESVVRIR